MACGTHEQWREGQHFFVQSCVLTNEISERCKLREVQVQAHDQREGIGAAAFDTCYTRVILMLLAVSSLGHDTCDIRYTNGILR